MAGSSLGSSGRLRSHSGPTSAEGEACAIPCNRGCAPGECTVQLIKSLKISIRGPQSLGVECFEESSQEYGKRRDISLENVLRTLSYNVEVEKVEIEVIIEDFEAQGEVLKPLFECMKIMPFLKSLSFEHLDSESLSVADAQAIFNLLVENNVLQSFTLDCDFHKARPSNPAIIAVLVDALLQNHFLQEFTFYGIGGFVDTITTTPSKGIARDADILRELCRYCKAPNNALTKLILGELTDIQVQQVADMLRDNKQLKALLVHRSDNRESPEDLRKERRGSKQHGIGVGNIGEALRNNIVLESLIIWGTQIVAEEMKVLMGALVPDASSIRQPNTSLLHLFFPECSVCPRGEKEWMEHLTTMLRSNTSLISLDLYYLDILMEDNQVSAEYAEMLFTSLWSNTSLERLNMRDCSGIKGK